MIQLSYKLEVFEGPLDLLLSLISKNKINILPTLVTTYGLKMNMYSNRIQRVVTMDALFEKAI